MGKPFLRGDRDVDKLLVYLDKRGISPKEAIDIIQASTPEAKEANKKFNWKMIRFNLFLHERIEQDKKGYLWKKTDTAKAVCKQSVYYSLYQTFNNKKFDYEKEVFNLFKLVTDPRQKPYFKSRYCVYKGTKKHVPQEIIDKLIYPRK